MTVRAARVGSRAFPQEWLVKARLERMEGKECSVHGSWETVKWELKETIWE